MAEQKRYRFKRQRADVHPELMADFIPLYPFKPKYDDDPNCYDSLTDESAFSDYAWAFLRRNRFYQNSIDQTIPMFLDFEIWGHKPSELSPASDGLLYRRKGHQKKYWEPCSSDGSPVEWEVTHGFFNSYSEFRGPVRNPPHFLDNPRVQIPFVFDIDFLLGSNTTAIKVQLDIARAILLDHAKKLNRLETEKGSSNSKKSKSKTTKADLRTLLRVADLLSPVYKEQPPSEGETDERKAVWEIGSQRPRLVDLVTKLPKSALHNRTDKSKTVSELVDQAYSVIYEWDLLKLLQLDNWGEYFFPTKDEAEHHQESRVAD